MGRQCIAFGRRPRGTGAGQPYCAHRAGQRPGQPSRQITPPRSHRERSRQSPESRPDCQTAGKPQHPLLFLLSADTCSSDDYDRDEDQTIASLSRLAEEAERLDLLLLLENEKGIVGATVARCNRRLQVIDPPTG